MKCYFLLGCAVAVAPVIQSEWAKAADLGVAPVPYVAPMFNWTGFYIGPNIGGGWAGGNITDALSDVSLGIGTRGAFIGGGQIGYNYQVGPNVVLGVEWLMDGIASSNNTSAGVVIPTIGLVTASARPDWVSTLAGRIGFTGPGFDHWLFYAKGGGGWAQASATVNTPLATFGESRTAGGWMAGGGIEWAFALNWTARIDYQFVGLENTTVAPGFLVDRFTTRNADIQTLTVGVNYLFNWGATAPVVSRY